MLPPLPPHAAPFQPGTFYMQGAIAPAQVAEAVGVMDEDEDEASQGRCSGGGWAGALLRGCHQVRGCSSTDLTDATGAVRTVG